MQQETTQPNAGAIVDRDGTLVDFVRDPDLGVVTPAFHPEHLRLLPGVVDGLHTLQDAGFLLSVATNQPDAAKGRVPRAAIERTNRALVAMLREEGIRLAAFETCLHHPVGGPGGDATLVGPCGCRKPAAGMLDAIVDALGLDRTTSVMIGDTMADLGAATAAGIRCALVVPVRRCELCPLADQPLVEPRPAWVADRFDRLADEIVAATRPATS